MKQLTFWKCTIISDNLMINEMVERINRLSKDPAFLAELDRRVKEYKTGKVKGISWEEAQKQILQLRNPAPRRGH